MTNPDNNGMGELDTNHNLINGGNPPLIEPEPQPNGKDTPPIGPEVDIFENLDCLRVHEDAISEFGSKTLQLHIPVRKPKQQEWVCVHPDPAMSITTSVFIDETDRQTYLVHPNLRKELERETKLVRLITTITSTGVLFLWIVKLPDSTGKSNAWTDSALEAVNQARINFVRVRSNNELGAYDVSLRAASHPLPPPIWPDTTLKELMRRAFKQDFTISSFDHPVLKRILG